MSPKRKQPDDDEDDDDDASDPTVDKHRKDAIEKMRQAFAKGTYRLLSIFRN